MTDLHMTLRLSVPNTNIGSPKGLFYIYRMSVLDVQTFAVAATSFKI